MTLGDLAQIAVAIIALIVAIYSIRRDRAILRVRFVDAAAGSRLVSAVNVGLRAVRVERMYRRRGWIRPRDEDYSASKADGSIATPLPIVVQPGDDLLLVVDNEEMYGITRPWNQGRWYVEDAAGHRYRVQ